MSASEDRQFEPPSEQIQRPYLSQQRRSTSRPPQVVNRALLLIQAFVRSEHLHDSPWPLITSRCLPSTTAPPPTGLPVGKAASNDFAGFTLEEIYGFMNANATPLDETTFTFEL
ncbi:hypothetical protein B0H19DRAFT_1238283 [Mycena capillaripes]|nr:hypothetical protein B0H19DRAFT_1238283 [Mycena capillaripes]